MTGTTQSALQGLNNLVEQQLELDTLWELGCDQSQGFLHSKAVSRDEFGELLAHGKGRFILAKQPTEAAASDVNQAD